MIKKSEGGWQVDIQPDGRGGKRFRKLFVNLAEAKNWEAFTRNSVNKNKEWTPEKRDLRKLSEIIKIWYDAHGKILSNAKDTYARARSNSKCNTSYERIVAWQNNINISAWGREV